MNRVDFKMIAFAANKYQAEFKFFWLLHLNIFHA